MTPVIARGNGARTHRDAERGHRTGASPGGGGRSVGAHRPAWPLVALLLFLFPLLISSCSDLIYQEAATEPHPVLLNLDRALHDGLFVEAEFQAAFGSVNAVHVVLTGANDGAVVVDEVFSVSPSGGEIRLQVEADLPEGGESFDLEVELRSGAAALFRGAAPLTLQPGVRAEPEIDLEPVAAGLAIQPADPGPLRSLGETLGLSASLVFATGHPFPPMDAAWQALDPNVVSVSADGTITAEGPGTGRIRAAGGGFTDQVEVLVNLEPASIEVDPAELELTFGETVQLDAVVRDAGGSRISVTVAWSSSDPAVATVSDDGVVEGRTEGSAVIEARAGSQVAEVPVTVVARAPVVETVGPTNVGARSARLRGRVNPSGLEAEVWFEWGDDPALDDPRATAATSLTASTEATLVGRDIDGLEPGTTYYFRAVASNEIGETRGEVRSLTTRSVVVAEIEVEPAELELRIGETAQLTTVVRDESGQEVDVEVAWSSSDTEVASVTSAGEVRGRARGTATIEARVGQVVGHAEVSVIVSAPLVETLEPADVTATSARLRAHVNPSGVEATAWFEWSTNPGLVGSSTTPALTLSASIQDQTVDHQLPGLQPGAVYYYRVVAENEVGVSMGEVQAFGTLLPAPTNLEVGLSFGEGGQWFEAFWSYDVESFPGVVFELEVRRVDPEVGEWQLVGETESTSFFSDGEDFTADVTYEFRVRACNDFVCSDWSASAELTPFGNSPFIENFGAAEIGSTQATLRGLLWDGGHETDFYFQWADNNDFVDAVTTPTGTTTRTGFSTTGPGPELGMEEILHQATGPAGEQTHRVEAFLTNLEPGQDYYFRAVAENTQGSYTAIFTHSFVTGVVPEPIEALAVTQPNNFSLRVTWDWPINGNGPDFFDIERRVGSDGEWDFRGRSFGFSFTDFDLEDGVQYGFRVRACFAQGGCSEISGPVFVVFSSTAGVELGSADEAGVSPTTSPREGTRAPPPSLRPTRGWE